MRGKHTFIPLIIFVIMAGLLTGCSVPLQKKTNVSLLDTAAPAQLYSQAISDIAQSNHFALSVNTIKTITTDEQVLQENLTQTLSYRDYGTDSPSLAVRQTYTYGDHTFSCQQQYEDGVAYLFLDGNIFSCTTPYDMYINNHFPVSFLTPDNYRSIEAKQFGGRVLIGFSQPSAPESWAIPQGAVFENASGTVLLSSTGSLVIGTYTITYASETASVQEHYTVCPTEVSHGEQPEQQNDVQPIRNIQAPILMERACALLAAAETVGGEGTAQISCELSGLNRTQKTVLTLDSKDALEADISLEVSLTDISRPGEITISHQAESFRNGVYTVQTGDVKTEEGAVTADVMDHYCRNLLVSSIPMLFHLENAVMLQSGSDLVLTFDVTEDFARIICAAACEAIYQDPNLLDSLATAYNTDTMSCTLQIDAITGLPAVSSFVYKGIYNIDGNAYTLVSESEQTYQFS